MSQYVVILGAALQLAGTWSYVRDTLRGDTRPNRMTWLMWAIAPLIAAAASLASGVSWAVLPVFMSGFGPLVVLLASFANRKSYWKLERFDYVCGAFSLVALALWWVTRLPDVAIACAIASDGFAAAPTLIKAWRHPETENAGPFTMGILNSLSSFAAIRSWTFAACAFPAYLVAANATIALATCRRELMPIRSAPRRS